MKRYIHIFFDTYEAARSFQRKQGYGALYCKKSRFKRSREGYSDEAFMAGLTDEQQDATPYCVAWNEEVERCR